MTTEPKAITQADLDAVRGELDALKAKNEELITENRKVKTELRAAKDIDPAEFSKLETENEKLRADLAKAAKDAKEAITRAEKAEKAYGDESGYTAKLLKETALNDVLSSVGVTDPDFLAAAKALIGGSAQVVTEGDARVVKIGDKALADHVKEWAASETAKKFISAPTHSGGGAIGGKGGATGKVMDEASVNAMPAKDRAAFFADGGQMAPAKAA